MKARGSDVLGPLEQKAEFVTQTFPGRNLKNFKGILRVLSDSVDVSLITLRTRGVNFTSLPAVPVSMESEVGKGTRFILSIPIEEYGIGDKQDSARY